MSSNDKEDVRGSSKVVATDKDHIGVLIQGCSHLICTKYKEKHEQEIQLLLTADGYFTCPIYEQYTRHTRFPLSLSGYRSYLEDRENASKKGKKGK